MAIRQSAVPAQRPTAATLMADVRAGDAALRLRAVEQAHLVGSPLIVPLGHAMSGDDRQAARAALEALRRVAHHCARPRASAERRLASRELAKLAEPAFPRPVRAEALHLLGMVASSEAVRMLEAMLRDPAVGEEARLALERIPGPASERALRRSRR
jgi:hydrogenase maturation factor